MPVDGPERCTSMISIGNSAIDAMDKDSAIKLKPGPDVHVKPRTPAYTPPIAIIHAAISSSVCTTVEPTLSIFLIMYSITSEAGVIG